MCDKKQSYVIFQETDYFCFNSLKYDRLGKCEYQKIII